MKYNKDISERAAMPCKTCAAGQSQNVWHGLKRFGLARATAAHAVRCSALAVPEGLRVLRKRGESPAVAGVPCRRTQETMNGEIEQLQAVQEELDAAIRNEEETVAMLRARAGSAGGSQLIFEHSVSLEELTAKVSLPPPPQHGPHDHQLDLPLLTPASEPLVYAATAHRILDSLTCRTWAVFRAGRRRLHQATYPCGLATGHSHGSANGCCAAS